MSDKIEPCPVCGNSVSYRHDDTRAYNSGPVCKCCGFCAANVAAWNAYARERRLGRIVDREFALIDEALRSRSIGYDMAGFDRVRNELEKARGQ